MTNKFSYIKKSAKYIIGAAVLVTSFGGAVFGDFDPDNYIVVPDAKLNKDNDGYYIIESPEDLKEFAKLVNENKQYFAAKGRVTKDIVFNEGKVVVNGELQEGKFEEWTPIGTYDRPFSGKLEGVGGTKKIRGLYINNKENYQGLFGCLGTCNDRRYKVQLQGTISDIEISDSYISGNNIVGGIVGYNQGSIYHCSGVNNIIKGNGAIGGIIGDNGGRIDGGSCCNSNGKVEGSDNIGGIVGNNASNISITLNTNEVTVIGNEKVGGIIGHNDCSLEGELNTNGGTVAGISAIGGNVGLHEGSKKIAGNCTIKEGTVKGSIFVGGNIGLNKAMISGICDSEKSKVLGNTVDVGLNTILNQLGMNLNKYDIEGNINNCLIGGNIGANDGKILNNCYNIETEVIGQLAIGGNLGLNAGTIDIIDEDDFDDDEISYSSEGIYLENEKGNIQGALFVGGNIGWNDSLFMEAKFNNQKATVTGKKFVGNNIGQDGEMSPQQNNG